MNYLTEISGSDGGDVDVLPMMMTTMMMMKNIFTIMTMTMIMTTTTIMKTMWLMIFVTIRDFGLTYLRNLAWHFTCRIMCGSVKMCSA